MSRKETVHRIGITATIALLVIQIPLLAQQTNVGSGDWVLRVEGGLCQEAEFRVQGGPRYSIGPTETLNIFNNGTITGFADSWERVAVECEPCFYTIIDDSPACFGNFNDPNCYERNCSTCFQDVCRSTTPTFTFSAGTNQCQAFSSNGFTFRFHRAIPPRPVVVSQCGASDPVVSLSVGGSSEPFQWEISKNLSVWTLIPGKTGNSTSISYSDLISAGLSPADLAGNLFARVKDPSCATRVSPASLSFVMYRPAPQFDLSATSPFCSTGTNSDNGTVTVNLTSGSVSNYKITLSYGGNIQYQESFGTSAFPITINKAELLSGGITGLPGVVPGDWSLTLQNDDPTPLVNSTGTCGRTQVVSVPAAPAVIVSEALRSGVVCFGENNGEFVVDIANGNEGFTYFLNGIATVKTLDSPARSPRFTGLSVGTYNVYVVDVNGCQSSTIAVPISGPPSMLVVEAAVDSQISCYDGANGILSAEATGGEGGYTFEWSNGQTGAIISGLSADSYEVTVTDARGCVKTQSIVLDNPPQIDFDIVKSGTITCPGDQTAILTVESITNSNGDESFSWSLDPADSYVVFDVGAGNHSVTVADRLGCFRNKSILVVDPPSLVASVQALSDFNGSPISCKGEDDGVLEVLVTKEDASDPGPLSYTWDTPAADETQTASNLRAGIYSVTVTDSDGCYVSDSFELIEPGELIADILVTSNYNGRQISCFGSEDGIIEVFPGGGVGSLSVLWDTGATTEEVSNLPEGNYSVQVSDANNCTVSNSISIATPPVLALDLQHPNDFNGFDISCNGLSDGSARASLTGGTAPYSYVWSDGQTSEMASGLPVGTYSVDVEDANGCPTNGMIELIEPEVLTLVPVIDNTVSCNGFADAEVSLTGAGGAGVYGYSMDGTTYQTSNVFSGLNAGSKDFYLRDGNNCETTTQETLTQPDPLAITFQNIVDATCNDPVGSAEAIVTGGNGGFIYEWFDNLTNQQMNSGASLVNAIASVYRVEVIDARNCQLSDLVAVSSIGGAEFDIQNIVPVTCFGDSDGSASINVTSGITPLAYSWSDGQSSPLAINLASGNYFATVTDGLGCRTIRPVFIGTPDPLTTSFNKILPNCVGDCDGVIEVSIIGGTGAYDSDWISLGEQGTLVSGLCAGAYDLVITDANNCLLQQQVDLPDPAPLQIQEITSSPICLGRCDGSIEVSGQGGTGPYSFQWQDGPSSAVNELLCPGEYQVTMTDAHGCDVSENITLGEGNPLVVDLQSEATLCVGQIQTLDPGDQWASTEWTSTVGFSSFDRIVSISDAGQYFFRGVDAIGCIGLHEFKLSTSLDLLTAEFLMASEVVVGDTLVAIDISWPLPERIEWVLPSGFTRLASENTDFLYAIAPEAGSFEVGMQSFLAECQDFQQKTVVVNLVETEGEGGRLGYSEDLIKEFSVSPNPNDGNFSVEVKLSESKPIDLRVISFPRGIIEAHITLDESEHHSINFELSHLSQGVYLVLLSTNDTQRFVRFVKTR
ncbi:MAG: hypothetical protein R2820_12150 [Cyclobacteriaceae bacterium]